MPSLVPSPSSRKRPRAGDLFAMSLDDGTRVYGRVIATGVDASWGPNHLLVYVYAGAAFSPDQLLIDPLMVGSQLWTCGVVETIENRPLTKDDVLPRHVFRALNGSCYDEYGTPVPACDKAYPRQLTTHTGFPKAVIRALEAKRE